MVINEEDVERRILWSLYINGKIDIPINKEREMAKDYDIGGLIMANGPDDLIDDYGMNEEAADWVCKLTAMEIFYINDLMKAARRYIIDHEDDENPLFPVGG